MGEGKYGRYILTELKMDQKPEDIARYSEFATRILWMDEKTTPGAFQMNCSWYFRPPKVQMSDSHHHDVPEIIGFFGSDYNNPHDLGGEIEFWLEDEKFTLARSTLIFVPAGMKHCPLILKRVDRPIFHFTTVTKGVYETLHQEKMKNLVNGSKQGVNSKSAQYVVTDVYRPPEMAPETIKKLEEWNHLILWIDDKVVPGSFQMNCCWFVKVPDKQPYFQHQHDVPEIIGLFGSDYQNPHDMGAKVEFWMEDEKFIINKSCMIFVPAGVKHCPLILKRVDTPIFHFTVVTSPLYSMSK